SPGAVSGGATRAPAVRTISAVRPEIPIEVEAAIEEAMAQRPEERFPRAADFARALRVPGVATASGGGARQRRRGRGRGRAAGPGGRNDQAGATGDPDGGRSGDRRGDGAAAGGALPAGGRLWAGPARAGGRDGIGGGGAAAAPRAGALARGADRPGGTGHAG